MRGKAEMLARVASATGVLRALEAIARRPSLLVLTYHRLGSTEGNRFDDGVFSASAADFATQMRHVRDGFATPPVAEVLERLENGGFDRPTVLVTFDDGYLDSYEVAYPVLRALGVPAILFVATGFVSREHTPWWDRIAYAIKLTRRPSLTLSYPRTLTVRPGEGAASRAAATREVLAHFTTAKTLDVGRFLRELEAAAEVPDTSGLTRELFMTWDQVREMRRGGISIGSHTRSHPVLSQLCEDEQRRELTESKRRLEEELGAEVTCFSYPVGLPHTFTEATKRLVRESGYRTAFSFYGGLTTGRAEDRFDVKRIPVTTTLRSFTLFRARVASLLALGRRVV